MKQFFQAEKVALFRPVARIFRRAVTCVSDVNVYMHKHARLGGSGGMLPKKNFIRCSEIASEAILGQQQSRCSYMDRGVLHPIFGCSRMCLLSQLTLNFQERRY